MQPHQLSVSVGDPLNQSADALVHPVGPREDTKLLGGVIDRLGPEAVHLLRRHEPLEVGAVVVTGAGELRFDRVVHLVVPTSDRPGDRSLEVVQRGLMSGLYALDQLGTQDCVIPRPPPVGLAGDAEHLAGAVVRCLLDYPPSTLQQIRLVDPADRWGEILRGVLARTTDDRDGGAL